MAKKHNYGLMDIPMSCSLFMEPALKRHKHYIAPMSALTKEYVHEWNIALQEVMNMPSMKRHLGDVGRKIIGGSKRNSTYLLRCVERAENVPPHSLHYALRFSESAKFLSDKVGAGQTHRFVDLGAGLSPLAAAIQTEHNMTGAYIIDELPIMEAYIQTATLVGGRIPVPITWDDAKEMSMEHTLDTIVAMGVMHYIPLEEQIERMQFINSYIPNFMLEIKYNNGEIAPNENSFNLSQLQSLRLLVNSTKTLETAVIQNSLRYISNFMRAMPNRRYFLENARSLFLSR
jgi:hypothetical protein